MIELYEKGTADIKKKKNKTKEEIEVEKQMKECTFHPNIQIEEKIIHTKFINDIENALTENTECVVVDSGAICNIDITAADKINSLCKSLENALTRFKSGDNDVKSIINFTRESISREPRANIEYVECHGLPGLYPLEGKITAPALLAVAVRFGNTRLIDNIILE